MLLLLPTPISSPPRTGRGRGWWWALLLALGLIVLGHGCHSGDHDIDDEPAVQTTREDSPEACTP